MEIKVTNRNRRHLTASAHIWPLWPSSPTSVYWTRTEWRGDEVLIKYFCCFFTFPRIQKFPVSCWKKTVTEFLTALIIHRIIKGRKKGKRRKKSADYVQFLILLKKNLSSGIKLQLSFSNQIFTQNIVLFNNKKRLIYWSLLLHLTLAGPYHLHSYLSVQLQHLSSSFSQTSLCAPQTWTCFTARAELWPLVPSAAGWAVTVVHSRVVVVFPYWRISHTKVQSHCPPSLTHWLIITK